MLEHIFAAFFLNLGEIPGLKGQLLQTAHRLWYFSGLTDRFSWYWRRGPFPDVVLLAFMVPFLLISPFVFATARLVRWILPHLVLINQLPPILALGGSQALDVMPLNEVDMFLRICLNLEYKWCKGRALNLWYVIERYFEFIHGRHGLLPVFHAMLARAVKIQDADFIGFPKLFSLCYHDVRDDSDSDSSIHENLTRISRADIEAFFPLSFFSNTNFFYHSWY
jgi:hypothetical protein